MGKADSDLGPMLKVAARWQTDMSQLTFVRCDATTRVARLLYKREGTGPKGPRVRRVHDPLGRRRVANRVGCPVRRRRNRANGEKRTRTSCWAIRALRSASLTTLHAGVTTEHDSGSGILNVRPGRAAEFEQAFQRAQRIIVHGRLHLS